MSDRTSTALLAWILRLGAAALAPGCGGPEVGDEIARVTLGQPAADEAVVGLLGERGLFCTGALVRGRVVLTAAHCAAVDPVAVFTGSSLEGAQSFVAVERAIAHPAFEPDSLEHDIAALVLEAPGLPEIAPVPVIEDPLEGPAVGAEVRVVGFGSDGDERIGEKMAGVARIQAVSPEAVWLEPWPSLPCFGDSGGPVLAGPGAGALLAVTSRGDAGCDVFAVASRTDSHRAFLDGVVAEVEGEGDPSASVHGAGCSHAGEPADRTGPLLAALALLIASRWRGGTGRRPGAEGSIRRGSRRTRT